MLKKIAMSRKLWGYARYKNGFVGFFKTDNYGEAEPGLYYFNAEDLSVDKISELKYAGVSKFNDDVFLNEFGLLGNDYQSGNLHSLNTGKLIEGNFHVFNTRIFYNKYLEISEIVSVEPYFNDIYCIDLNFNKVNLSPLFRKNIFCDETYFLNLKYIKQFSFHLQCYKVENDELQWEIDPVIFTDKESCYKVLENNRNNFYQYENLFIVVLRTCSIVALDKSSGEKKWQFDYEKSEHKLKFTTIFEGIIYGTDFDYLITMNPQNGQMIDIIHFKDIMGDEYIFENRPFQTFGEILVTEDIIAFTESQRPARILIVDRKTFKKIDIAYMDDHWMVNGIDEKRAVWHNGNLLYVDGLGALHTFTSV